VTAYALGSMHNSSVSPASRQGRIVVSLWDNLRWRRHALRKRFVDGPTAMLHTILRAMSVVQTVGIMRRSSSSPMPASAENGDRGHVCDAY
jgi:hypothetical protein